MRAGVDPSARIHHFAVVDGDCRIGPRTVIYQFVSVIRGSVLGADCVIAPGATIDGAEAWDGVSIGANAVIMPGVILGARSIVAAGAVVTKHLPPDYIWHRGGELEWIHPDRRPDSGTERTAS